MPSTSTKIKTVTVPPEATHRATEEFEQETRDAVAEKPELLRLDCSALKMVVSSHIDLLWMTRTLCLDNAVSLCLFNPPVALMRILNVLDLVEAFEYEGDNHQLGQKVDRDSEIVRLPQTFTDTVRANSNDIDEGVSRFLAFLGDIRAGATTILELRTVYYEIATNIRVHSGISEEDQFLVNSTAEWNQITLTFTDPGKPFDSTIVADNLDPFASSLRRQRYGFGLSMVRRLIDSMTYSRNEWSCNVLILIKKWHR